MLRQEQIVVVIDAQKTSFLGKDTEVTREALKDVPIIKNYATMITGIRRCGKSTLLLQLLKANYKNALYFNFEDIRLVGFDTSDFVRLQQETDKRNLRVLFLDEIQLVEKWEIFVHQLLREGYTVFVTGSNASLLSKELGTHLTGRHVSMELFPFSYREYLSCTGAKAGVDSLASYLETGGFPEFVKSGKPIILSTLMDDILVRDIAIRHAVRDVESLKQLAVYLVSNTGNLVSANKLAGLFGIKSAATLLEFFSYFKDAYLLEFLPQFSYSQKARARNPKKVYAMDTGLISAVSTSFTPDTGRKLENLVYLHLRRHFRELYYFKDKGKCDFVAFNKGKAEHAVQVCHEVGDFNFEREYNGLRDAMKFFNLNKGVIVTSDQQDRFDKEGYTIELVPAYEYLTEIIPGS